jgi:hypothetical protein
MKVHRVAGVAFFFAFACGPNLTDFAGRYSGTATYVASSSTLGPQGAAVAAPSEITIDDGGYDGSGRIRVHVAAGCLLEGHWTSRSRDTDRGCETAFIEGTAVVEPGQSCSMAVTGGTAVFETADSALRVDTARNLEIIISGKLQTWMGNAVDDGLVELQFNGRS